MIPYDHSHARTGLSDAIPTVTPEQARAARLTVAERALADGWAPAELVDVLGALGLVP